MKLVQIGSRVVGLGHPAYIIAEAGANHDQNLSVAHRLIDVAAKCGADAVKFQTYTAETLYSRYTPRLKEMDDFDRSPNGESPFELIRRIELPREWQREMRDHAVETGLDFLSTPFDLQAVEELAALDVKAYKIASYEITYCDLIKAAGRQGRPVILSTGNSGLGDIEAALAALEEVGNNQGVILHCVSQYPTRYEDLNLRAVQTLALAFDVPIGFSDHTMDSTAAAVAVAFGASCFEKHFTLDRRRKGPDHPSAMEPEELAEYICAVRNAEKALGSSVKRVQPSEEENHRLARRSLHAAVDIPEGTVIAREMLTVKRPALGIHPSQEKIVVGRRAQRTIKADEWITWEMV
jgi:sialic acid synthase SpsE